MIDPRNPDYANTPASDRRPGFGYAPADPGAEPLVSIITPFFNTREIFDETATSVFRQSLQQWEWVIVNDASTDAAALALLDGYRRRDPRIRVLDNAVNEGLPGTRNVGIAASRSDLVFLLDDDDLMEPTALEKFYFFLQSHPEYAAVNGWSIGFGAHNYLWPAGFERGRKLLESNSATGRTMVRRSVHREVGGHDASIRGGMEDWEFWLRLADHGYWGATLQEYMDWYRRRANHADRWENLDNSEKERAFRQRLRERYRRLYEGEFPDIKPRPQMPLDLIRESFPACNRLTKSKPRMLMIVPWLTLGGADKFNLDLVEQLVGAGWEVSIATTMRGDHSWGPQFARYTPDIFAMHAFLHPADHPAFLAHLIESRQVDAVLISNSELGYLLLPYLRASCPRPVYLDYCHSDTPHWKAGGYPRYAVANQDQLDLSLVASKYLRAWMTQRGAEAERIRPVYINVDAGFWQPDQQSRQRVRALYGLDDSRALIFFAGRLHADKQPQVLVATLALLRDRGLDFYAVLAGDGPERAATERFIRARQLEDRVRLLGEARPEAIRDLLAGADVFFLPSRWEGIALTIYEAMACGVPVVGADVGGQRELVTPECGVLLPRSDEEREIVAYADALQSLLADPARRLKMGQQARQRIAEHFTLADMGRNFLAAIEQARQWQQKSPRSPMPMKHALESANQAVELMRLAVIADRNWLTVRSKSPDDAAALRIQQLEGELEAVQAEAARLAAAWEQHTAYIRELTDHAAGWEAEAKRLAAAWEENVAHIQRLEQRLGNSTGGLLPFAHQCASLARRSLAWMRRSASPGEPPDLPGERRGR